MRNPLGRENGSHEALEENQAPIQAQGAMIAAVGFRELGDSCELEKSWVGCASRTSNWLNKPRTDKGCKGREADRPTLGQGSLPAPNRLVGLESGVLRGSEEPVHLVLSH